MSLAATIARFYGQGKEEKNAAGWVTLCPVHGDNRPSLSVKDAGDNDVDVFCHTGCDWKEIKDRFRADGLLPEWKPERRTTTGTTRKRSSSSTTSSTSSSTTKPSPTTPPVKEDDPPQSEKESYIWKQAGKDGLEHARTYLAGRAITMELPVCLRWNNYKDKKTGEQCHVIVAAASKPTDTKVYAVQRLFIDLETHKKIGAKMHGPCEGRGVWFNRKGDLSEIIVGEGIETTLSAMQATGKNGVASLSTSGAKNLIFPDATETVYFLVDSDPVREKEQASMPGQKAAVIAAKAFVESRSGRKAYIVTPDDTCFTSDPTKIDFNDLLKQDPTGASIRARFDVATDIRDLSWEPPKQPESDDDLNDTAMVAEMFDRYVFLASENKIIDSHGYDIKDSMMIERAFIIAHAGKFYHFVDGEGEFKTIPLAQHWVNSGSKKIAAGLKYQPGEKRVFVNGDGRAYYNVFRFPYESMPPVPPEEIISSEDRAWQQGEWDWRGHRFATPTTCFTSPPAAASADR